MKLTYRTWKAAPLLSDLARFIKIVRADFEKSANMQKHPLINYPHLNLFLLKTPKNRISVLVLYYIQTFINTACTYFVSRDRHRVQSTHDIFIKPLFRTPGTSKRTHASKSRHRFFFTMTILPYRESKKCFDRLKQWSLNWRSWLFARRCKYIDTWTHEMHFTGKVAWTHGTQPSTFCMGHAGE